MATTTTNYSFNLPEVGADEDDWGTYLNANWTALDTTLKTISDLLDKAIVQVGGLYLSTTDTDPATTLGYGTWAAFGAGYAIVGVGGTLGLASEGTTGATTVTLSADNIPSHAHSIPALSGTAASSGGTVAAYFYPNEDGALDPLAVSGTGISTTSSGTYSRYTATNAGTRTRHGFALNWEHTHSVTTTGSATGATGSTTAHSNVQPSIGVYIWKRTA